MTLRREREKRGKERKLKCAKWSTNQGRDGGSNPVSQTQKHSGHKTFFFFDIALRQAQPPSINLGIVWPGFTFTVE